MNYVVYGGELKTVESDEFKDTKNVHVVGVYLDIQDAYSAWKANAQRTVDNAHMRYFIKEIV